MFLQKCISNLKKGKTISNKHLHLCEAKKCISPKKLQELALWHSEFIRSFQGRKIAMAICAKKTMSDESRYFSRGEEFVFGDFPAVEIAISNEFHYNYK